MGIEKLKLKLSTFVKITSTWRKPKIASSMRNMHEIFWKAGIPHGKERFPKENANIFTLVPIRAVTTQTHRKSF